MDRKKTELGQLATGDRFYFESDEKRQVYKAGAFKKKRFPGVGSFWMRQAIPATGEAIEKRATIQVVKITNDNPRLF